MGERREIFRTKAKRKTKQGCLNHPIVHKSFNYIFEKSKLLDKN